MLQHRDVWRAIDRLAEKHGLTPSGLARKAGLSATLFNPSKRSNGTRKRWPSTESIAAILKATDSTLDDFIALTSSDIQQHRKIPLLGKKQAEHMIGLDILGEGPQPDWDEISLPGALDSQAFAIEIPDETFRPVYHEGDRLILSPGEKLRRGDRICLRTHQGEMLIKRLGRAGAHKIELLPLSSENEDPPLTLARQDVSWMVRIIWASQ